MKYNPDHYTVYLCMESIFKLCFIHLQTKRYIQKKLIPPYLFLLFFTLLNFECNIFRNTESLGKILFYLFLLTLGFILASNSI